MPDDELQRWLKSRKPADLCGRRVRPREHPLSKGTPLTAQGGQAEVLFLRADDGSDWIVKRFQQGRCPDEGYMQQIAAVLPPHRAFVSGNQRQMVAKDDIRRSRQCYHSQGLVKWLQGAVFMPTAEGVGWSSVADDLRSGTLTLGRRRRLHLCRALSELVQLLESCGCAHRDLSCGNVFVSNNMAEVSLIDFDSVFHPQLKMPRATTSGTQGYMPAFVWTNGNPDTGLTWRPHADRFALTILNTEFLTMGRGIRVQNDGGMFSQQDLRSRSGPTIETARRRLSQTSPEAIPLFEQALRSNSYDDCPSPTRWIELCHGVNRQSACSAPAGEGVLSRFLRWFTDMPQPQPPRLSELPCELFTCRPPRQVPVSLPPDPWGATRQPV